ncbi:hypothetical protein [Emticicia sp. SJ17W-69]|uniref:hypothetical protein n=1 Tax=Emticicia sp. SJ17W-69 TaxID=3421657 RepID=UPI003EC072CC
MKRIISFALIAVFASVISCKKSNKDISPQQLEQLAKCPLKNINTTTGTPLYSFEYTLSRIKRIVNKEGEEVGTTFTYNNKNQIEKMEISTPRPEETYTVLFQYDAASGKIIKAKTSVKGYEFQINDFVYAGDNITSINTSLDIFGYKLKATTRVEYTGGNVSKVFTKIEGEPELLVFEGVSYDTKAQFYPDGYQTMALGFVGLANNFFAYFGKNNPTSVKVYDDNGKLDEATNISYEYNKYGLPSKGVKTVTKGEKKTVLDVAYQYTCN